MAPVFEALLTSDEATVRKTLGVPPRHKEWPSFRRETRAPDQHILEPAVQLAAPQVRRKVRGTMKTNKHGWARWIIENADDAAHLFKHEIAVRIQTLLL